MSEDCFAVLINALNKHPAVDHALAQIYYYFRFLDLEYLLNYAQNKALKELEEIEGKNEEVRKKVFARGANPPIEPDRLLLDKGYGGKRTKKYRRTKRRKSKKTTRRRKPKRKTYKNKK